ncbi:ABC transporter permease [Tumidithrix helvetica PCC 7403]
MGNAPNAIVWLNVIYGCVSPESIIDESLGDNHHGKGNMLSRRLLALLIKESTELLRNRQLVIFLTLAPILSMVIFGYVLNSNVNHLRLSILDQNQGAMSRDFINAFTENHIFLIDRYSNTQQDLTQQVAQGKVDAGLMIPPTFSRDLLQTGKAEVGFVIDGINAYSSGLAKGYVAQITTQFNLSLLKQYQPLSLDFKLPIQPQITFRYNPGTLDSWFFVPGVIGAIMTLSAILAAAVEAVREKDQGTLEQLLMTPVASTSILISKIVPISGLLSVTLLMCFATAHWIFQIPFRGNVFLLLIFSILFIQIGVSIGLAISAFSKNKLQTILIGIFLNIPIILLGGAVTSINSMPLLFRWIAQMNPLYHYLIILRGILLKGVGLEVWGVNAIAMFLFAVTTLFVSARHYRSQLN